jgi:two-component SAPR family response regulator
MRKPDVYEMEQKIEQLTNKETFYEDVRQIVGFYDETVFIEDWDIKRLQRVADARYAELGGK